MEEKINIAAILNDKPNGIRLYSPIFGECAFCYVREDTNDICVKKYNGVIEYFNYEGLYFAHGEVMLFPSKEMRDWSKFFNKGDVLVCYEGKKPYYTIFDCFESNTYKGFNGKFAYDSYEDKWYQNEGNLSTNTFYKLSIADSEIYITKIEERFGGKMNHETLDIENTHPEFKDGDIVFEKSKHSLDDYIAIYRTAAERHVYDYCSLNLNTNKLDCTRMFGCSFGSYSFRLATESEKQQLFEALAKKNKAWDSEKKQIVDLKPKAELNPMDWCLMRGGKEHFVSDWTLCQFSHKMECGKYRSVGGCAYDECLPYNEETAHLLGTTDDWEGGEG